jgi:hypothetical protein
LARNKHKADDETSKFEVHAVFNTRADAEAFLELANGMADGVRLVDRKKTVYSKTVLGWHLMKVFAVPNRAFDYETLQAATEEAGFSASSTSTYLSGLVAEGLIYKVGTSWARRYTDDTAAALCPNVHVVPSSDGQPAGLE